MEGTTERSSGLTASPNIDFDRPALSDNVAVAGSDSEKGTSSSENPEQKANHNARTITGLRWFLLCTSLYITTFLYGLDTTIAADVQGPVVKQFGHVEQLAWVGAGFPLGSVSVIILDGVMYSTFNMKWMYIASIITFEVGSAICGAAPSMGALIVGRVIAGAGGSGVFMGGLNYFGVLTTAEERGFYVTLTGFCWGIGAVLGPVIGGSFATSSATWRWAFYINLVIGAIGSPFYLTCLPPHHPKPGVSIMDRVKKLDFVGLTLNTGVWVTFTMAFTMAGGQWPWNDGRTIGMFVAFGVILVTYALQQVFCVFTTEETRCFPVHLLRSYTQILLYIGTAANITSLFIVVYFVPIYFQFVHNDSALLAAARLLPYVFVTVSFNLAAGRLLAKINYYMPIFVVSGLFITLGSALLTAYFGPSTPEGYIYGFTIITAVGSGLTLQIGYAVATIKVDSPKHISDALSLQNVAQLGGTVISLVIAGQVFQSTAIRNLTIVLAGQGYSAADIQAAVAGAESRLFEELTGTIRDLAVHAITDAMQMAFVLVCVSGAVVTVAGCLMKREKLFGDVNAVMGG